jgi:hypothetical protein
MRADAQNQKAIVQQRRLANATASSADRPGR